MAAPSLPREPVTRSGPRVRAGSDGAWAGGSVRLLLTRRAPDFFRAHANREVIRIGTLLVADLISALLVWRVLVSLGATGTVARVAIAAVVGLAMAGCYGAGDRRRDIGSLIRGSFVAAALVVWPVIGAMPLFWVGVDFFGYAAALGLTMVLERRLIDTVVRAVRPADQRLARAVVVGHSEQVSRRLIDHPVFGDGTHYRLVAFHDPTGADGDPGTLASLIRERQIDTLVLAGRLGRRSYAATLDVAAASGCQVLSLPRMPLGSALRPQIIWHGGSPIVELTRPGSVGLRLLVKRAIDIVGSAVGLVILAPVFGVIALLIRRLSPGPIFFRQTRIGRGGRTFEIIKFRTMVPDAEEMRDALAAESVYSDGRLFKVARDPRITPIGAVLRRTSLDELPQLWNVLRGDMSLVGPRPPLPSEVRLYQDHHYARFDVKPGITGPWQVSGRNDIRDFEQVVRLETAYIRRWSIWLDVELLLRTVPVVLSRRGAL